MKYLSKSLRINGMFPVRIVDLLPTISQGFYLFNILNNRIT